MKKALLAISVVLLLNGLNPEATPRHGGSLTFAVTAKHPVITRRINKDLLLRVERWDSVGPENFGWDIQVVRKQFAEDSPNLLYHSTQWHGPYPSQVCAWHIAKKYFPNERELAVRGHPYDVKIILVNPVVAGEGPSFVSGEIKIVWKRK